MSYMCPVCGYPELDEDPSYIGSFEICPSCGFQFGVSDRDRGFTYEQWRNFWKALGMKWLGSGQPPEDWNPKKQLQNLTG